jgi:hypothetical protein
MSLKALREIFIEVNPTKLSKDLAACLAGDPKAVKENKEWYED